jgi:hypothetical protein
MRGIFEVDGLRIVGRHIVAWSVREGEASTTKHKVTTTVWTTSDHDEVAWEFSGDHGVAILAAVQGK